MKYFLSIGGIRYDYQKMEFGRVFSKKISDKCDLLVSIVGARVPAIGDAITIEKEVIDTKIAKWKGTVAKIEHIPYEKGTVRIVGFDKKRKIQGLHTVNLGYSATKGSSIISTEIAPVGATDLTAGTIDTSDAAINTVNFGKEVTTSTVKSKLMRSDALEIVEMMSDREIKIDIDGVVTTTSSGQIGTNRSEGQPNEVVLLHGINGQISPEVGYSKDEIKRVKQVIVKGQGVGNNFIIGAAGTPASTDQIKQIELPFIQNNTDAATVAQGLLSELDKEFIYTVFELDSDLYGFVYDLGDTVTLKGTLPTISIDEDLRIFEINYTVDDNNERVKLTLANFRRGVWAKYVIPEAAAENQSDSISLNLESTQAQQQLLAQTIQETFTGYGSPIDTDNTVWEDLATITFNSKKTLGAYFIIDCSILPRNKIDTTHSDQLFFRIKKGSTIFPSTNISTNYLPLVGKKQNKEVVIYVPDNTENNSYIVQAITGSGRVDLGTFITAYSVGY